MTSYSNRREKNHNLIRITGRDAQEIETIEKAADKVVAGGSRVLGTSYTLSKSTTRADMASWPLMDHYYRVSWSRWGRKIRPQ